MGARFCPEGLKIAWLPIERESAVDELGNTDPKACSRGICKWLLLVVRFADTGDVATICPGAALWLPAVTGEGATPS